jgi:hypothetical protein
VSDVPHDVVYVFLFSLMEWLRSATFGGKGWSTGLVGAVGGAWIATAGGLAMIEVTVYLLPAQFLTFPGI